ncbi:MAG: VWA domain-containing protein [Actinomycetota bacterium]|nr:VWA domain-containing protein [Actinomycetota bacterium]
MKRRLAIGLGAALITAAAAVQAAAAAVPAVQLTPTGKAVWPDRELVISLRSGQRIQPSRFKVLENGRPVLGARVVPSSVVQGTFGAMLVIDTSNSMRGGPIRGAVVAARAFAARRNVNQRLSVLVFNSSSELLLPFTSSQARIERALARTPGLAYGTHIYDAVGQAIALIRSAGLETGTVVLLSDGTDTGSSLALDQVRKLAETAHVRVFTVGLRSRTFRPAALQQLAAATGGSFSAAANPKELATIYDQLGLKLANQYLLTYRSLVVPGARVHATVAVTGVGRAGAAYAAPEPATISLQKPLSVRIWQSWVTMLVICFLVAGLVGLGLFVALRPAGSTVRRRLSDFVTTAKTSENAREPLASRIFQGTEHSLEQTRWWQRLKEALELADVKIPPIQLLVGTLILTLFVMWLMAAVIARPLAVLGLAVPFLVRGFILYKIERKRRAFGDQLPDNLDVVASGLRAGHSLVGGLSLVINDAAEPSRSEFRRVVADEQLGVPLEDALSVVARRMQSRDVEQVALVSSLQRETGSNSAEVLDRVIESIRERSALRRLVRGLTAQGRLSRWIVTFLPVGLLLVITAINPTYMKPLFTHTSGRLVLAVGVLMIVAGSLVIKKIVDIKV